MGRDSSIAKVVGINVAGLALALVGAEIALRIAKPEALQARLKMNELMRQGPTQAQGLFKWKDFRFSPNSKGQQLHSEYQHSVQHDQHGWRNPCFDFDKPATSIVVGDSYIYGIGVSDRDLMQCQIKTKLPNSNIYAMGIPGAAINQYIRLIRTHAKTIKKLSPNSNTIDLAICMGNDFEVLAEYGSPIKTTRKHEKQGAPQFQTSGIKKLLGFANTLLGTNELLSNSHVLQSIKLGALQSSSIKDHGDFYSNYGGQTFYKKNATTQKDLILKALLTIKEDIRKSGFKLGSLILIPDGSEISEDRLARDAKLGGFDANKVDVDYKFNHLLDACKKASINCIDFRSTLSADDYYMFDGHFRPSGVAAMSNAFTSSKESKTFN